MSASNVPAGAFLARYVHDFSLTPGVVPLPTNVSEISLNLPDRKGFTKLPDGSVIELFGPVVATVLGQTRKLPFTPAGNILGCGDSFMSGQGASSGANAFLNKFAARLGLTTENLAVGGRASWMATTKLIQRVTTVAGAVNQTGLAVWMAGFNDVYRGRSDPKTIAKIQGELRSWLSIRFAATAVAATAAAKTGVWTDLVAGFALASSRSEQSLASRGVSTVVDGATLTQTFTGDHVVIHTFATDGVNQHSGGFTATVDGVAQAAYNGDGKTDGRTDGAYNNQITHDTVIYKGFGAGTHTLVLTAVTDGVKPVYVDSIETMMAPSACGPILVGEGAFQNAAGWAYPGSNWSEAAMRIANAAIKGVCDEFAAYPVAYVPTNDFFRTDIGLAADNNHPNDIGHAEIAQAFLSGLDLIPATAATALRVTPLQLADRLVEAAGTGLDPSWYTSVAVVSGTTYTIDVVLSAEKQRRANLYFPPIGCNAIFDLVSGTCTGAGATITPVGGSWYKCSVTGVAPATATNNLQLRIFADTGVPPRVGDGVSGIYVKSAVMTAAGSSVSLLPVPLSSWTGRQNISFVADVVAAALATPTASGDMSAADKTKLDGIITKSLALTVVQLTEAAGAAFDPSLYRSVTFAAGTYTVSFLARKKERQRINVFNNAGLVLNATFDLSAGTCTGTGATIEALAGGFYRCAITGVAAAGTGNVQFRIFPDAGSNPRTCDGTSGLYVAALTITAAGSAVNLLPADPTTMTKQQISAATVVANFMLGDLPKLTTELRNALVVPADAGVIRNASDSGTPNWWTGSAWVKPSTVAA